MVVVATPATLAEDYVLGEGPQTVADYNEDFPAIDPVIEVVYPQRTSKDLDDHQRYAFPRGRLKLEQPVHDRDDQERKLRADGGIDVRRIPSGDVLGSCPECNRTWRMEPRRDEEPFIARAKQDVRDRVESHLPCDNADSDDAQVAADGSGPIVQFGGLDGYADLEHECLLLAAAAVKRLASKENKYGPDGYVGTGPETHTQRALQKMSRFRTTANHGDVSEARTNAADALNHVLMALANLDGDGAQLLTGGSGDGTGLAVLDADGLLEAASELRQIADAIELQVEEGDHRLAGAEPAQQPDTEGGAE
ncbi:hypothetical protein ACFQL1_01670 [Halomicroarcula sp. GCM10025709]|uniref:hypothetical protein n=1 Tax=Halomicroarcula sp. GCM10025709 TaxID=3252669 RepID=UPI003619C96B